MLKSDQKKYFLVEQMGFSGYPNSKTIVDPKDATRNIPNSVLKVNKVRADIVTTEKTCEKLIV